MVGVETEAGFRKAGISRYAIRVVAEMLEAARLDRFELYVNERFSAPEELMRPNVRFNVVKRHRAHRCLACARSSFQGFGAWFVPAYDSMELPVVPQVAMVHDMFPITHPEWFPEELQPVMREAIERTLRVSRTVLTNSEATKAEVLKVFDRHPANVRVTPLAIGNVAPVRERESIDLEELRAIGIPFDRFLLTVGTIEPRKNLRRLLAAWEGISSRYPDVGLVVAGARGWGAAEPLESDRVHFLGYVDDSVMPALYGACELFVLGSLDEGFGMPVLESMHYGAPVVLSDRGAIPEVGGPAAVYFDPESEKEIGEALARGLARGPERERLVEIGRTRAANFSWQRTAVETLKALRSAAGVG
jgi:glycosyltransferase involved in cell wall biosynthesis